MEEEEGLRHCVEQELRVRWHLDVVFVSAVELGLLGGCRCFQPFSQESFSPESVNISHIRQSDWQPSLLEKLIPQLFELK